MKYVRMLLLLMLLPGCAEMGEFFTPGYYEDEEYYEPETGGCQTPMAPTYQAVPAYQPSTVQPAGYQTKEPPR